MRRRVRRFLRAIAAAGSALLLRGDPWGREVGLCAFVAGAALRVWALGHLRRDRLTRSGPYGLVRHPLYLGSLLCAAGYILLLGRPWLWGALAVLVPLAVRQARREERRLERAFPEEMRAWRAQAVGWFARPRWPSGGWSWRRFRENRGWETVLGCGALLGLLEVVHRWCPWAGG